MEYKKDKQEEFSRIYAMYKNDVYRTAMVYTKDSDTANEVVQEVFYKLYVSYEEVHPDTVRALLVTMAKNYCLNRQRQLQREVSGELLDVVGENEPATEGLENRYLKQEETAEKKALCGEILKRLSEENPTWSDALIQVYYLKRSQAEVAEELDISIEVLNSRLYRARKWIRKHYQETYDKIKGW